MQKLNSDKAYKKCKKSPSGLLISIWNQIGLLSLTNYVGGKGIQIHLANKTYHFYSLETLNVYNYGIVDANGIAHGKMSSYNELCNYVICNDKIVCGVHASSHIAQFEGCLESEIKI